MSGGYARFFGGIDHEACEQRELAADAGIWTLSSTPNVKPECATADPVRGRPWKPDVVRYMSVDTATRRPAALQGDTRRDREKTARIAAFMQLAGRFRRWWSGVGFEPT
jgi:hypothetical protein